MHSSNIQIISKADTPSSIKNNAISGAPLVAMLFTPGTHLFTTCVFLSMFIVRRHISYPSFCVDGCWF